MIAGGEARGQRGPDEARDHRVDRRERRGVPAVGRRGERELGVDRGRVVQAARRGEQLQHGGVVRRLKLPVARVLVVAEVRLALELGDHAGRAGERVAHRGEPALRVGGAGGLVDRRRVVVDQAVEHRARLVEHEADRGRLRGRREDHVRAGRVGARRIHEAVVDAAAVRGADVAVAALGAAGSAHRVAEPIWRAVPARRAYLGGAGPRVAARPALDRRGILLALAGAGVRARAAARDVQRRDETER